MEEIKRAINEIRYSKEEATITTICLHFNLKPNYAKVLYYLEYLVNAQEVRYRYSDKEKTGVYTVLKV